jgi:hypothetical protein
MPFGSAAFVSTGSAGFAPKNMSPKSIVSSLARKSWYWARYLAITSSEAIPLFTFVFAWAAAAVCMAIRSAALMPADSIWSGGGVIFGLAAATALAVAVCWAIRCATDIGAGAGDAGLGVDLRPACAILACRAILSWIVILI